MVIFDLRLLIVRIWTCLCIISDTFKYSVVKTTCPSASKSGASLHEEPRQRCVFLSLSPDVRAGMSGSLPGGSVISRLLINADPFNSEPENL